MSLPLQLSAVKCVRMEGHALHQNSVVVVLHSQDQSVMKVGDTHTHRHTHTHTHTHNTHTHTHTHTCMHNMPLLYTHLHIVLHGQTLSSASAIAQPPAWSVAQ